MVAVASRPKSAFGTKLRELRQEKDLTQQELGERIGTNHVAINRLENGAVQPTWATAVKLASALGVSLDVFRGDIEPEPPSPPPVPRRGRKK